MRVQAAQPRPEALNAAVRVLSRLPAALTRLRADAQRPDAGVDRHLYSLVTMRFDGTYNKLYTVTGQYRATDAAQYDATVKECVASFRLA